MLNTVHSDVGRGRSRYLNRYDCTVRNVLIGKLDVLTTEQEWWNVQERIGAVEPNHCSHTKFGHVANTGNTGDNGIQLTD
eukprot:SAG22_NODE_3533_length_1657_cov_1.340180_2_plen_79_part_01